jgi:hypothetical protein
MKIAHLILAHSNARHLERLVARLENENAWFFIHIDKKTPLDSFSNLSNRKNVTLLKKRVSVGWGAYSMVQATINGFEAVVSSQIRFDVVNLLSGSDYPIKSREFIHHFFAQHHGKNYFQFEQIYSDWTEAIGRLTHYHLTNYNIAGRYFLQKWMNKLLPKRKIPEELIPVGRSQWFSITLDSVIYILDYLSEKPQVARFFRMTWAPDEIIFQTILYNSTFRESMINNSLRYIDWVGGKTGPRILTKEDLPVLKQSHALFARKFDQNVDPEILDLLDCEASRVLGRL